MILCEVNSTQRITRDKKTNTLSETLGLLYFEVTHIKFLNTHQTLPMW